MAAKWPIMRRGGLSMCRACCSSATHGGATVVLRKRATRAVAALVEREGEASHIDSDEPGEQEVGNNGASFHR